MSGAKSPRGEQHGRVGTRWETELRSLGEVVCSERDGDDSPFGWIESQPEDRPSRATRRAGARRARQSTPATPEPPFGRQEGAQQ